MQQTILFVHGMFQTGNSWDNWVQYFSGKGYTCIAPSWPDHEGEPASLRQNPPSHLGDLRLEEVVAKMEEEIGKLTEKPIVIGHSVGGLVVQLLAAKGIISRGVPISSVAPNAMLSLDWDFFKNSVKIANPFKGDEPFYMDEKTFHSVFANTMSESASAEAFERTATHDSRNVLRDCMMGPGKIDLELAHPPLFFIAGTEDKIIPHQLVEKNSRAYKDDTGLVDFKEFENRSHFICGEPGWEEVAASVEQWLHSSTTSTDEILTHQSI